MRHSGIGKEFSPNTHNCRGLSPTPAHMLAKPFPKKFGKRLSSFTASSRAQNRVVSIVTSGPDFTPLLTMLRMHSPASARLQCMSLASASELMMPMTKSGDASSTASQRADLEKRSIQDKGGLITPGRLNLIITWNLRSLQQPVDKLFS